MDEQRQKLETLKARREKLVRRYCIFCLIELAIMVLTAPFPGLTTLSMIVFALLLVVMLPVIIINETMKSKIKKLEASLPPKPMTPPVPPAPPKPPVPDDFRSVTMEKQDNDRVILLDSCIGAPLQNIFRGPFGVRSGDAIAADMEKMGLTAEDLQEPGVLPARLQHSAEDGWYLAADEADGQPLCLTRSEAAFRKWLAEYVADRVTDRMDADRKTRSERAIRMVCSLYPPAECRDYIKAHTRRLNGPAPTHRFHLFYPATMTFHEEYGIKPSHLEHAKSERRRLQREALLPKLRNSALRQLLELAAQELEMPDCTDEGLLQRIQDRGETFLIRDPFCAAWPCWDETVDLHHDETPVWNRLTDKRFPACALLLCLLAGERCILRVDPGQAEAVLPAAALLRQIPEAGIRLLRLDAVTESTRFYTDLVTEERLCEVFRYESVPGHDITGASIRSLAPADGAEWEAARSASGATLSWQLGEHRHAAKLQQTADGFHLYFAGPGLDCRGCVLTSAQRNDREAFLRLVGERTAPFTVEALFLPLLNHL